MIPVRTAAVNSLPRVSARLHRCIAALRQTMHMACRSCNKTYVSLQPHFLLDLAEAADGEIEVFLRVAGGDLRAIKAYGLEKGIPCWISMEEKMACGVGACLACVCQSTEVDGHSHVHNKRICKDGPVFLSTEIEL